MIVNRNKKKHREDTKMKTGISKCSKLKRAISHKILKKPSSKPSEEKTTSRPVLLISMISNNNEKKNLTRKENSENFFKGNLLQPLDVVIEEARYQLSIEKLRQEKMGQFGEMLHQSNCCSSPDSSSDDIYEEMDLLQTFYESIYDGDYMDMGLVV